MQWLLLGVFVVHVFSARGDKQKKDTSPKMNEEVIYLSLMYETDARWRAGFLVQSVF